MKEAPASIAFSNNSKFKTVPAPMHMRSPAIFLASRICAGVSGEPIVISRLRKPPRNDAFTISATCGVVKPRKMPTMGRVVSNMLQYVRKDESVGGNGQSSDFTNKFSVLSVGHGGA